MKPNPEDRKYFFAMLDKILRADKSGLTKHEAKEAIKALVFSFDYLENWSIAKMNFRDLQMLKEAGKLFAYRIGLDID